MYEVLYMFDGEVCDEVLFENLFEIWEHYNFSSRKAYYSTLYNGFEVIRKGRCVATYENFHDFLIDLTNAVNGKPSHIYG